MARYVVAKAADLPPGARKRVTVKGREIAIFNVGGELFGILDRCPHQGGSLCEGRQIGLVESSRPGEYAYSRPGEIVRCPWHGWEFDLRTGRSRVDPRRIKVRSFGVDVEDGETLVQEGYETETFEVSLDGEYVVVEA